MLRLGLLLAASAFVVALLLNASLWLLVPALVVAGTCSLAWNGLSFTATAEIAGRSRAGSAIGLQQSFLAAGSIVAPILFSTLVHATSWRLAFLLAAMSPLVGYILLSPLAER
jgi:MFS family permease